MFQEIQDEYLSRIGTRYLGCKLKDLGIKSKCKIAARYDVLERCYCYYGAVNKDDDTGYKLAEIYIKKKLEGKQLKKVYIKTITEGLIKAVSEQ